MIASGRSDKQMLFQYLNIVIGQRNVLVGMALLLTVAGVSLVNPAFATWENARDLLVQVAPVVIVGCGMTLVVLVGEIDISVGSVFGVLAAVMGLASSPLHWGLSAPAVVGMTIAAGATAGLVNGLLVTVGRVPSIVATLGMLTIVRGVTELSLGGNWITDLPPAIRAIGTERVAGLPWSVWVAAIVVAVSVAVMRWTTIGVKVRAVGGNADAAKLARVSVTKVKLFAFVVLGVLTGVAAAVSVPQQSVIEAGIGNGFELVVVTAVVVGGTSIRGGVGGIVGTVLAALLLGSIRTGLVFLKLGEMATFWERAIQGSFILAAVFVSAVPRKARNERGELGKGAEA